MGLWSMILFVVVLYFNFIENCNWLGLDCYRVQLNTFNYPFTFLGRMVKSLFHTNNATWYIYLVEIVITLKVIVFWTGFHKKLA